MFVAGDRIFDGKNFRRGTLEIQAGHIKAFRPAREGVALITPGLIDSHLHLVNLGLDLQGLQLRDCLSQGEFVQAFREYSQTGSKGWITGRGWDQNKLGFTPTRQLLDSLCPDRPAVLTRTCGHVVVVNSKALEMAGIANSTEIVGGVLRRDSSGELTGILEEKAVNLVTDVIPQPDSATLYSALVAAIKYAQSYGITGAHTDDRGQVKDYLSLWGLYYRVTQSYPLRVQLHYTITCPEDLRDYISLRAELQDTAFVYKGAAKIFLDGSLGAGTAALVEDYSDDPGSRGVLVYDDCTLREIVTIAEEYGIQLAVHAIGDRATEQFLRILEEVRGLKPGPIRHRLVHFQVTNISQINRAKALDLAIEIQPAFLRTDMHWAESRLGYTRLQTSYCWQTMDNAGLYLSGGSDSPVEEINPWLGVAAAVTRQDGKGNFASAWRKDESLGLERALSLFTSSAAGLAGWQQLGSVSPGKIADLAIYSQFDPGNLWGTRPNQVLVQGNIVYQR
jgi:hypothetical protein